jgi:hypothetical protein
MASDVSHSCMGQGIAAGSHTISVQQYGWCCVGGCANGNNSWAQQGITVEEMP